MLRVQILVLAALAAFQVLASPPTLVGEIYNSIDCTGPVLQTILSDDIPINFCITFPSDETVLINGVPTIGTSIIANCPADTFSYGTGQGGPTCDSPAIPFSSLCIPDTPISYKIRCAPSICKPDSALPRAACGARASACGQLGADMKWYGFEKEKRFLDTNLSVGPEQAAGLARAAQGVMAAASARATVATTALDLAVATLSAPGTDATRSARSKRLACLAPPSRSARLKCKPLVRGRAPCSPSCSSPTKYRALVASHYRLLYFRRLSQTLVTSRIQYW
jgi:hypothetical protein